MSATDVDLRPLQAGELSAVEEIERTCFANPWPRSAFELVLHTDNVLVLAASVSGQLSGYVVAAHFGRSVLIANLAVTPAARRRGVASALLRAAIDWARVMGAQRCRLEVRESNRAAAALYGSFGFRDRGRVRGYYRNPEEDAVTMVLDLVTSSVAVDDAPLSRRDDGEASAPAASGATLPERS